MKNKKGFTLVELLAVIVILALIMGVAIVGIGNVISGARTDAMWENAQSVMSGVKKTLAVAGVDYAGKSFAFGTAAFESGGNSQIEGKDIEYATSGTAITDVRGGTVTGIWSITTPSACSATTKAYVTFGSDGTVSKLCLPTNGGKRIEGSQTQINSRDATNALKSS